MLVRKLRLQKGWSQEQLATVSGLSTRTIQRIEKGESAGLETYKSLAAVFDVNVQDLREQEEWQMNLKASITEEEREVIRQVKEIKGFYAHFASFLVIISFLTIFNVVVSPHYLWVFWVIFGWGLGVALHALEVFDLVPWLGPEWEKREVEKRLGRKL